ncbi:MAG: hypothetical protein JXM79_24090 [Sedimentisphaerales bacterium]|nr:hypothetical protein [Sedimentisphaerales bacterium]
MYEIIEACSPGPYIELFARGMKSGWEQWGNEVEDYYPSWSTYKNHSQKIVSIGDKRTKKNNKIHRSTQTSLFT